MNRLAASLALLSALLLSAPAHAVPQIGLEILEDGILVAIFPLTSGGGTFTKTYSDALFTSVSLSVTGAPTVPDPNLGSISISASSAFGSGSHTLTLIATQTGLTGFGTLANTFNYNGLSNPSNVTSVVGTNYVSATNTAFAQTTQIATTSEIGGSVTYSSPVFTALSPTTIFSETEVFTMTFKGQALAQSSAQITGVPEPAVLSLVCAGLIGLRLGRRKPA